MLFVSEDRTMFMRMIGSLLASGLLVGASCAAEDENKKPTKEALEMAHKAIVDKFPVLKKDGAPPFSFLDNAALERTFSGRLFISVIYRMHPVAVLAPTPLKSQNVFVVAKDGGVEHFTTSKKLEKFFRSDLGPVKSDDQAKDAVRAWLTLSQQFVQDGFFQFTIPDKEISGDARKMTGKAVVEPKGGNKGYLAVTLTFEDGKLAKVQEENQVKVGVRPICQATKLLDLDPIVRGMAEQCLLVMGSAARGYLAEQRAKATPELQQAIDRIWQRIVEEDR
jgi:hypothetical protein